YRTRYARLLYQQRRFAEASRQLERNNWRISPPPTYLRADDDEREVDDALDGSDFLFGATLMAGPAAAAFESAEKALHEGRFDDAKRRYEDARRIVASRTRANTKPVLEFLDTRLRIIEDQARLADGQWIKFMPTASFGGWRLHHGGWRVEPDGALLAMGGSCGSMLVRQFSVGANFEIRGSVEFVSIPKVGES